MLPRLSESMLSRRSLLQVGGSSLLGLSLPSLLAGRAAAAPSVKAAEPKSVILIFLTGGASHLETFDPKPAAPAEIRGEFKAIATKTPGLQIGEHLPLIAQRTDKLAILRTMSHINPAHLMATHHVLTGMPVPLVPEDAAIDRIASRTDFPCYASALHYLRPSSNGVPSGVTLPTFLVEGPLIWPGQHAGLLGGAHDPWHITQDPNKPGFRVPSLTMPEGLNAERISGRKSLLESVNAQRAQLEAIAQGQGFTDQQRAAFALLAEGKVASAFEIDREKPEVRDRYGRHAFGQSMLLARRLVEAGVPIVQCNMGHVQTWDTHSGMFPRLKNDLLPPLDHGVSALLDDLSASGRLDHTLVAIFGEFGRTPKIGTGGFNNIGRDHWPSCFFAVFAGAGVKGGQVIGRSDKSGAVPVTRAYRPNDLAATIYQTLGIDRASELHDRFGRPMRLCSGEPIEPLFTGAAV